MPTLALTGATGKLGGAVLEALLDYNLIASSEIAICTSSDENSPKVQKLKQRGVVIRHSTYDDPSSMEKAFTGCKRLLIVSSPRISMDFYNAPPGKGREAHHFAAIDAARKAGVQHIYYTSLAFASNSKAAVMWAHNRTEDYLKEHIPADGYTVIREGLYNESWPLYFGYYDPRDDDRTEVIVAGDGPICWTAISDLGLATALILVAQRREYAGQIVTLTALEAHTLNDVSRMVSEGKSKEVSRKVVSKSDYKNFYINQKGMDPGMIDWWAHTYEALPDGECQKADGILVELLKCKGRTPKPIQDTIREMLNA
jgi:uncharacterized protein YbjT (DUF2867 family)